MAISSIEKKQADIEKLISTMVIDTVGERTFAILKSCTGTATYEVTIDESGKKQRLPYAVDCTCEGNAKWHKYCHHMKAVDVFYAGIVKIFAPTPVVETPVVVEEVAAPVETAVTITDEEIAAVLAEIDAEDAKQAAKVVEMPKVAPSRVANYGTLNGNRPFILPKSYAQMEAERKVAS